MDSTAGGLRLLLVGEERRLTRAAVGAAGLLFFIAMVVEYLALAPSLGAQYLILDVLGPIRTVFAFYDLFGTGGLGPPLLWVYTYLLVAGLAAVHAYFNLGYLTSLMLALAPSFGSALWVIDGVWTSSGYEPQHMLLTPMGALKILPGGLLVATLGFLIGAALRSIHHPSPTPDGPSRNLQDV